MLRKVLAFTMALVLFLGCVFTGGTVRAQSEVLKVSDVHINPLYQDSFTEADLVFAPLPRAASGNYTDSLEVLTLQIREGMKNRQSPIMLYINMPDAEQDPLKALIRNAFAGAISHTGIPTEGDYLRWQYGGWSYGDGAQGYYADDGSVNWDIPFYVTYYTTSSQEAEMDTRIDEILDELDVYEATEYQIIRGIYDYICANVTYDYDNLEDDSYKLKHTAYAAVFHKTAVCQGYALLFYRLALELGVDARLIAGDGGGAHGWNIAKIGQYYYNLDSTWDAGSTNYSWFLRCPDTFVRHTRYDEYETADFHQAYPMAPQDYVPDECDHSYTESVTKEPFCLEEGITTHTCTKCGDSYTSTIPALGHDPVTDKGYAATCTEDGLTDGSHCSRCGATITAQTVIPATGHRWDNGTVTREPTEEQPGIRTYTCTVCGEIRTEEIPYVKPETTVTRVYGDDRCATAIEAAKMLKTVLEVAHFDTILIASGDNFADALTGSYLANVKGAPILLHRRSGAAKNQEFILENLSSNGTVYILGGTNAVPESVYTDLTAAGIRVERLHGDSRYSTNLEILNAAGVTNQEILICTGIDYADSLAASATGLPIVMVNNLTGKLTAEQIAFFKAHADNNYTIVGGINAVSQALEKLIEQHVDTDVQRVYGDSRETTSVAVAQRYIKNPESVFLAFSRGYPDGLCGGPLAYAMGSPLILINNRTEQAARDYIRDNKIHTGFIMGGTNVVSDNSVAIAFDL